MRLGSLKFLLGYWKILSKKFREGTDTIYILLPQESSLPTFISSCWIKDRLLNHEWNIRMDLRICDSSQWFYVNVIPKPHFWRNWKSKFARQQYFGSKIVWLRPIYSFPCHWSFLSFAWCDPFLHFLQHPSPVSDKSQNPCKKNLYFSQTVPWPEHKFPIFKVPPATSQSQEPPAL